jgi:hypothetical protein
MFSKKIRATISILSTTAFLNATGIPASYAQDSSDARLGDAFGNLLGAVIGGALGIGYKQTPMFRNNVLPYIKDMAAFDAFMTKYNYQNHLNEKDGVDIIIKLGVLQYHPEWLNENALKAIDKYYPGARSRRGEIDSYRHVAVLCSISMSDSNSVCEYDIAQAQAIPLVIFTGITVMTIAAMNLGGLSKANTLKWLTAQIQQMVNSGESELCSASGGCSHADNPVPVQAGGIGVVDCAKVIAICKEECTQVYANGSRNLPGSGRDMAGRWRRCVRECAKPQGCDF